MANSFEAVGKLHAVMETQQVTDTFRKREFVLEIADGNYPQHVKFQLTQDRCSTLDRYSVGQDVKVLFNLKGRPYNKRDGGTDYWLNLEAWRLEAAGADGGSGGGMGGDYTQVTPTAAPGAAAADFDDVPF